MNATAGSIISSAIYYCGSITLFPAHVKSGNFYAGSPIQRRLSIGDGGFSQASENVQAIATIAERREEYVDIQLTDQTSVIGDVIWE